MPSKVVTALVTAQEVVAERADAVVIPTSMLIDNKGGSADRTIWIQDIFTPSPYYGTETPSPAGPINRHRITVVQGDIVSLSEEDKNELKYGAGLQNKLLIDATVDWTTHPIQEEWDNRRIPLTCTESLSDVVELVNNRWKEYGL